MRQIAFSPPDITEKEISAVADVLRSGWITSGPKTAEFEEALSMFYGTKRTLGLSSATAALELALRLLNIGEGDEVITSAYTYTASASVITHVGATVRICDVSEGTIKMDCDQLRSLINEKTKAVIPVDVAGVMEDYDSIFSVLEEKKDLFVPNGKFQESLGRVAVVSDAAHSLGAVYKGIPSGRAGDLTAFSFHAVKNLTTAEGGALTWKSFPEIEDDEVYAQLRLDALHGQSKDALKKMQPGQWEYDIVFPGRKCNMTDIQAAIGLVQLDRYSGLLQRREKLIQRYDAAFKNRGLYAIEHSGDEFTSSGHLYMIRIPGYAIEERNRLIEELGAVGISANVHYKPLPLLTAYINLGFDIEDYPNAYDFYRNEVTLPLHTLLSDEDQDYIIEHVLRLIE
ncbi:MAG: DegT/DnrJ/EryC1/StrS aminotransferase family protein [Tissierellia bacterium]|nr:DegT/DnrJ/EryC1/StrS aminotransferase family protein [Bacillota bacterium]NLL23674.1 DegT/DnrJ/EryC1/StrS aminotransferase family protein [Tissierellia bacterium]